MRSILLPAAIGAWALLLPAAANAAAAQDPINFERDQAVSGRNLFTEKCSSCHGADLEGRAAPALKGAGLQTHWLSGDKTLLDLFNKVQQTMPVGAPGSLTGEEYLDALLYILSQSGYQPTGQGLVPPDLRKILTTPADTAPVQLDDAAEPTTPFPQKAQFFGTASSDEPGDKDLAQPDPAQWLMYNKDYTGERYSALKQIDSTNASSLVPQCIFQTDEIGSFQTSPVVYGGVLYITTPYNTYAIDAATCRKIWANRYPPDKSTPWTVNRGVGLYRGKLFRGTPNGHLIALDAKTGKLLWDVWMVSKKHGYWLSGAPIAYRGLVYMGTAGADWGANGFIEAFDADTGRLRWKFDVIPTGKQTGADSWQKGAKTGGGSFWSSFALDRAKGELLLPVGNPAPDFRGDLRPGANLFTNSVVALDAKTGKLRWWVQQVPHDTHDWDTAAAPILYDQDGRHYMAVANKGGWLYIYDRRSHALLAQPEISRHENADVPLTKEGVHHCPGTLGGTEWNGPAYSPAAKALYVNSIDWCNTTQIFPDNYVEGASYFDGIPALDPSDQAKGFLHAFDAGSGKPLWARRFDNPMVAGITPTAGGVLFTGTLDGDFLALDAQSGKTLYSFNTGGAIAGAPSTYLVGGKQFVAIPSGNNSRVVWQTGGTMMVVIFALRAE